LSDTQSFLTIRDAAYEAIGIMQADVVYIYSDFRVLGAHAAELGGRDPFCKAVVQPFLDRGKTVLTTTFTYTTEGRFDTETTPTKIGAINKWILSEPDCKRSEHPLFSYAAIGPRAGDLMENIGKSAFGYDSVFDRLYGRNASFLYVGRPVWMGNTIIHHVEQSCGATYRANRSFRTEVYRGSQYIGTDYSAFLRRRDVEGHTFAFRFEEAASKLFEARMIKQVGDDKNFSNFSAHGYDTTAVFLKNLFYKDSSIFIDGTFND
jgi:aminoglycoside 3-N-acetyltransferase